MIPKELKDYPQWTYSYSIEELKRPFYSDYAPRGGLTYDEAMFHAGFNKYVGFYVTYQDPYVLLDVDHVTNEDDLPKNLKNLIKSFNPTYCETSPSGEGLRIIYRLPDADAKAVLTGSSYFAKEVFKDNKRNIQMNVGQPWMTITGNATAYSVDKVATINLSVLDEIFNLRYKEEKKEPIIPATLPSLMMVKNALFNISLDQNPRVKRSIEMLTGSEYHHYDFWLKVLMSLHDFATKAGKMVECFNLGLIWSKTDKEAFTSDEDVKAKWDSFKADKNTTITYNTIFKISKMCSIWWPDPGKSAKKDMERGLPIKPFVRSVRNVIALFKFYNIELHRDEGNTNQFFITADTDIRDKYFTGGKQRLEFEKYIGPYSTRSFTNQSLKFFMDKYIVGMTTQIIKEFIDYLFANCKKKINIFKLYYNTPFEELPLSYKVNANNVKESTFEGLWSCLELDDTIPILQKDLCKSFYLKWLYNLLRNHVLAKTPFSNNIGILLLTGPEQIRKTSHFYCLLPAAFRHKIIFTSHGFKNESDLRDTSKISATNMLVIWDEIEQFLTTDTEANFKKTLDANAQTFIDKYETVSTTLKPIAIYGATSNQSEFRLSGKTSRRILNIPIKWIDTDKMNSLCWHPILHDVEQIMLNEDPLLTPSELEYQARYHENIKAKTNIDYVIREVYDFNSHFNKEELKIKSVKALRSSGRLLTLKEVATSLSSRGHSFKRTALRQSLMRACTFYSRTTNRSIQVSKYLIKGGILKYGTSILYVMPDTTKEDDPFE